MTDATPWLNEQEARIWRAFIEAGARINTQLDAALKARSGLTFDDYEVLVHLSEADPQRLRMSDLSERLLHSQSRVTQRIDRLAKRGLVCREKCPEDRRGTFAVLTPEGFKAISDEAPNHVRDVRQHLIDHIELDEREMLVRVLERLATTARDADKANPSST